MIELLIYALLAALIFSRLYNSLGRSTNLSLNPQVNSLNISKIEKEKTEDIRDYIDDKEKNVDVYELILKKDRNFSISNFMEGASIAFELIIKYFNQGNLTHLKSFLDKDLYNPFAEKISNRKNLGENYESVIVSIISQKVVEIQLVKNLVFIAVEFVSEQINFTKDNNGTVISGSTSVINKVEDVWQFKKNINSSDPSWLLTSINYKKTDDNNNSILD